MKRRRAILDNTEMNRVQEVAMARKIQKKSGIHINACRVDAGINDVFSRVKERNRLGMAE